MRAKKIVDGLTLQQFKNEPRLDLNLKGDDEFEDFINLTTKREITREYHKESIRQALRKAGPSGATSSEIAQVTNITPQTAKKYLDELCSIREAYKLKRNRTTTIYYNNGKPRRDFGLEQIEDENLVYEISLAEGPDESLLLHIIEKRYTLLEGEQIEGGVIIPLRVVPELIGKVKKMYKHGYGD